MLAPAYGGWSICCVNLLVHGALAMNSSADLHLASLRCACAEHYMFRTTKIWLYLRQFKLKRVRQNWFQRNRRRCTESVSNRRYWPHEPPLFSPRRKEDQRVAPLFVDR